MSSIETYEVNLDQRLSELKRGDPAYTAHIRLVLEAIVYARQLHGVDVPNSILDCGCGLGFMTAEIAKFFGAVGIDPSAKSISLAKAEHPHVSFYHASAESFPEKMLELNIPLFDQAVLNMVLHSVDDESALDILEGVKKCLKPEGAVILIIPTEAWLPQKLIEYAQDQDMEREPGIAWVNKMLHQKKVDMPVKIRNGKYYPSPVPIYNRAIEDYEKFLQTAGFGFKWNSYDHETGKLIDSQTLTYLDMNDYWISEQLYWRNRTLMMSFSLPDQPVE
jgi:SAM-dependent methyltransferase